jgi:hypothetical protein
MSALQLAWIVFAIGISSGTIPGFLVSLIGLYGIWKSIKDEK